MMCNTGNADMNMNSCPSVSDSEMTDNEHYDTSSSYGTDERESDSGENSTGSPSPQSPTSVSRRLLNNARSALQRNEFDTSFAWYCTLFDCLESSPNPTEDENDLVGLEEVENEFSTVVNCFSKLLLNDGRDDDAEGCIQKGFDMYPANPRIHMSKANLTSTVSGLISFSALWRALLCFNNRENWDDYFSEYRQLIDFFGRSEFVDRWHFRMLNDRRRNLAYKVAIQQVFNELRGMNEGDHGDSLVLFDLGCGTGLMSAFAAECGFKSIVACDESEVMFAIAEQVLQPYSEKESLMSLGVFNEDVAAPNDLSFLADVKIDVIVAEIFDCGFFGEKAMETLSYVYENLSTKYSTTRPFTMIPAKARVFVTAVESVTLSAMFRTKSTLFDVKFPQTVVHWCNSDMLETKYENVDIQDITDCKRITEQCLIYEFDFNNPDTYADLKLYLSNNSVATLRLLQDGRVDAFVVHFELELSRSCKITTNLWDPNCCTCWGQAAIMSLDNELMRRKNEFVEIRHRVHRGSELYVVESRVFDCKVDEYFLSGTTPEDIENMNNFSILQPFLEDYFNNMMESSPNKTEPTTKAALVFAVSPSYLPYWLIKCQNFDKVFVYYVKRDEFGNPLTFYYRFHAAVLSFNEGLGFNDCIKEIEHLNEIYDPQQISFIYSDVIGYGGTLNDFIDFDFNMTEYPLAHFLPNKVNIYGQFISSTTLRGYNEIIDDQNVCGVKLKDKMSIFKSKTFFDHALGFADDKIVSEHPIHVGAIFPQERNLGKSFDFPPVPANALTEYPSMQLAYSFGLVFGDDLELKTHEYPVSFHVSGTYLPDDHNAKLVITKDAHFNYKVYFDLVDL